MTQNPMASVASCITALNALLALLNVGGAGTIKIYTGTMPVTPETVTSGTLLATLTFSTTAFPTAIDNSSGGARATANTITSETNAPASGSMGYFRAFTNAGTCILQGTAGSGAVDLAFASGSVTIGGQVALGSFVVVLQGRP